MSLCFSDRYSLAQQLITRLYNVQVSTLQDYDHIQAFCKQNQFHPIQHYFNAEVLDTVRGSIKHDFIYYITDAFQISFALFTIENIPILIGPFSSVLLTKRDTHTIFARYNLQKIDSDELIKYCSTFPFLRELDAQNIVNAFINTIAPNEPSKTFRKIAYEGGQTRFWETAEVESSVNHAQMINQRYTHEQHFFQAIIQGNSKEAINNLHLMQQDVLHLKRIGTTLENEKVGSAITRTTVRLAALQAGLPAPLIDKLSSQNTIEVQKAKTADEILLSKERMIRNFCKAIYDASNNQYSALVQSVLYHLRHNYQAPIHFGELADALHVTETHMIATFRKQVGTTPNAYLTKLRLEEASLLLHDPKLPIQEVSSSVGIEDANYFVKLFKKEYQMTPSAYRKQHTI